ncbi:MAG: hypothetical protein HYV63_18045 [Candidatus Schekmanbacteria bacterium]|nr:hypothetical protein [Candidatus Schekmanbacteria bacterium]
MEVEGPQGQVASVPMIGRAHATTGRLLISPRPATVSRPAAPQSRSEARRARPNATGDGVGQFAAEAVAQLVRQVAVQGNLHPRDLLEDVARLLEGGRKRTPAPDLTLARSRHENEVLWQELFVSEERNRQLCVQNEALERQCCDLREQHDVLQRQNDDLRADIRFLCRAAGAGSTAASPAEPPAVDAEPMPAMKSVRDAVRCAEAAFTDTLFFLPSAFESAAESPFVRPEEAYRALRAVSEVAATWQSSLNASTGSYPFKMAFADRGYTYKARISDTARGKHREQYLFVHKGRRELFQAHITLGAHSANSCLSIHLLWDRQQRRAVIAHVGRHLRNTQS